MSDLFDRAYSYVTTPAGYGQGDAPTILETATAHTQQVIDNLFYTKLFNYLKLHTAGRNENETQIAQGFCLARTAPDDKWFWIVAQLSAGNVLLHGHWYCSINDSSGAQHDTVFWTTPESTPDFESPAFVSACEEAILLYASDKFNF